MSKGACFHEQSDRATGSGGSWFSSDAASVASWLGRDPCGRYSTWLDVFAEICGESGSSSRTPDGLPTLSVTSNEIRLLPKVGKNGGLTDMEHAPNTESKQKCAREQCQCEVGPPEEYCSDYCSGAEAAAQVELSCCCGHAPCEEEGTHV